MSKRGVCVECKRDMNIIAKGLCGRCYHRERRKTSGHKKAPCKVQVAQEDFGIAEGILAIRGAVESVVERFKVLGEAHHRLRSQLIRSRAELQELEKVVKNSNPKKVETEKEPSLGG